MLLNGGAALLAAGVVDDLKGGIEMARESLDSKAALGKLDTLIEKSRSYAA